MRLFKELFGETGDMSMMRLLCFISLIAGIILAFTGHDSSVMIFVTAAFGGKTAQKYIETKNPS